MQFRVMHPHTALGAGRIELRTQMAVGTNATGDHQSVEPRVLQSRQRLFQQNFHNRGFRRGSQIGLALIKCVAQFFGLGHHRRFESCE